MFTGPRSCINLVSRVVHLLTHIDDARAYIVPYLHRRFTPRHLAPTVGLVRVDSQFDGSIFISDDDEFITASVKRFGLTSARARHQHRPRIQLIQSTESSIKVDFYVCASLQHLSRLQRSTSASTPTSSIPADFHCRAPTPTSAPAFRVRMGSGNLVGASKRQQIWNSLFDVLRLQLKFIAG